MAHEAKANETGAAAVPPKGCCPFQAKLLDGADEQRRVTAAVHCEAPIVNGGGERATANQQTPYFCAAHHLSSEQLIQMEDEYAAHNYHPLPCVISRASGVHVWDPEGRQYFDFLSAYSAVNQGHCHPAIVQALVSQAQTCTLTSRAFFNDMFPRFARYITEYFGYDMVLPMNTGAEAVETALKLARKWGYRVKGIAEDDALVVCCRENFHGRTLAIVSMSTDLSARQHYGPYLPGLRVIPYNDAAALETLLQAEGKRVCAFLVEPIQGEAGVVVPADGYLRRCAELCRQHRVLLAADEVQTGLGRTGRLLACEWDGVRPDLLILGKALSGGVLPLSAVLASRQVMLCVRPGEHGSTFGGNPLAAAVGIAALEVIRREQLPARADRLGARLREALSQLPARHKFVTAVRGRGLLQAVVCDERFSVSAWDICVRLKERGLLAKPTHEHVIRLAPPLVITEDQLEQCVGILYAAFDDAAAAGHFRDAPVSPAH